MFFSRNLNYFKDSTHFQNKKNRIILDLSFGDVILFLKVPIIFIRFCK
jgi:hypothetical protein